MRLSLLVILLIGACGSGSGLAGNVAGQGAPAETALAPDQRIAPFFAAIVPVAASRDWAAAQAAFPGARWEARTSSTAPTVVRDGITYPSQLESLGYTDFLEGGLDLNGGRLRIIITGTPDRVTAMTLVAPDGVAIDRAALRRALAGSGVTWRLLRCDPLGDGRSQLVVELTAGGRAAVFQDTFSGEASSYNFSFDGGLYDPADPPGDCAENELRELR